MNDAVDKIKERLTIFDVVSPYVELQKAGKNYKGKSPFTNEKTPSFYVSPDRGMYYCFSSSQGGDIFTFVEKMEGVDFKGALKILAEKAGVELVREDPEKRSARDAQYALLEEATKFFFGGLTNTPSAESYVTDRGVTPTTIHAWRIGYAPDAWRGLREHLAAKGYSEAQMQSAGLVKKSDEAKESYDVFRNRIMFPITDNSGRVVAYSGRTLTKDPDTPKYVNSPETELYQKSEILFGYDKAKQGIRQFDFALIVEGQFDLVLAHQAGYTNTVAVSGTAFTTHHLSLLERLSNRVVLALDSDRAGVSAVKRAGEMILRRGMDIKVVHISDGKDPADIIAEDPKQFKAMVGSAKHIIEFLLEVFRTETKDDRAYKLRVREEVVPLIGVMPNRIDREHFEGVVADALGTTKDAIHYEVERILEASLHSGDTDEGIVETAQSASPRRRESLMEHVFFSTEILAEGEHAKLSETIRTKLTELITPEEMSLLVDCPAERKSKALFTLEQHFEGYSEQKLKEEFSECLTEIAHSSARSRLAELRVRLREAEVAGDGVQLDTILSEVKAWEELLQRDVTVA